MIKSKRTIIIWTILVAVSGTFFYFLSSRPNMMLWVEEFHPSNAYQRGRELKEDGNLEEAFESFRLGSEYFLHLAEENQSRRHWLQYVQGLMEMAKVSELYGDADSLQKAVSLIAKAVGIEPRYAQGEPFLSMGVILRRLKQYREAIDAFTGACDSGGAYVALDAVWERALCYWELGDKKAACRDWSVFTRFKGCNAPQVWDYLVEVPNDLCRDAMFLHACKAEFNGDSALSNDLWGRLYELDRNDRCVKYYDNSSDRNWLDNNRNIDLADIFPFVDERPLPFYSFLFDVFNAENEEYQIQMELSCPKSDLLTNKVVIDSGNNQLKEIVLLSPVRRVYSVNSPMHKGSNVLRVRASRDRGFSAVTPLYIHSLSVRPKNR